MPLIRTADHDSAERRALQRRARRGELHVVRPGVFAPVDALGQLLPEEHHVLLARASAPVIRPPRTYSHATAAAIHGLPFVEPPPRRLQVRDPRRTLPDSTTLLLVRPGGRTTQSSRWSGLEPTSSTTFCGASVTSLVRTLVDVAATAPAIASVPMIDAALGRRLVLPEMLVDELSAVDPKEHARADRAVAMGSPLSGSPAESIGRVRFRQVGAPDPVQQQEFTRPGERRVVVDFWFPDQGVVVEVDGRAKYEDPALLGGRTTADAHWQEKRREDFLRSFPEVRFVVRFSWADLMDLEAVRAALVRVGIPCR
ncbi:hypothetical protein BIU98_02930 [Curtobacterium sp. MMLR14_010]|nr:hypothetical protein BIU98_02930 [Curtobacterium sp. MMLR14_010]